MRDASAHEPVTAGRPGVDADALAARYGPVAAAALVGLALALRLPGLFGWWTNPDEGIYLAIVTQESFGRFLAEAFATAHPPLYFLLLRAMAWISADLTWLRALALASGCAAVWAFVRLGRGVGGDGARGWLTGLAAGLLLAVSPSAIDLSRVVRPYMLLALLLALALHFLLRYQDRPSRGALFGQVLCISLAVLLHYSAALAFGVMLVLLAAGGARHGIARPAWRRAVAAQAIPAVLVAALYFFQMRQLMASDNAEFSVEAWLSGYLIDSPFDVWLTLVGFHAAVVGTTASVAATCVTLIAVAWAAMRGNHRLALAVGVALLVALCCAALRLYPFGAGRHSAWLLPFVVPALAWAAVSASSDLSGRIGLLGVVAAGMLLRAPLGAYRAEPALPEQVLRDEHVAAMGAVLDPREPPYTVIMSQETYRLLLPLYYRERQHARESADGASMVFRWGARDVLVLPGLDVAVRRDQIDQPNHLLGGARRAAAELGLTLPPAGEPVLVLSGSWRQGVFDLAELARQEGLAGATQLVPGLVSVELDLGAYARALGAPPPPGDSAGRP